MANLIKRSNNWQARINRHGIRTSATFATKAEADAWAMHQELMVKMRFSEINRTKKNFEIYGDAVLNHDDVLKKSVPSMAISAIYLLIKDGVVIYVGKSKNALSRISGHYDKGRIFDRYTIIPCSIDCLDETEQKYISAFDPMFNRTPQKSHKHREKVYL